MEQSKLNVADWIGLGYLQTGPFLDHLAVVKTKYQPKPTVLSVHTAARYISVLQLLFESIASSVSATYNLCAHLKQHKQRQQHRSQRTHVCPKMPHFSATAFFKI